RRLLLAIVGMIVSNGRVCIRERAEREHTAAKLASRILNDERAVQLGPSSGQPSATADSRGVACDHGVGNRSGTGYSTPGAAAGIVGADVAVDGYHASRVVRSAEGGAPPAAILPGMVFRQAAVADARFRLVQKQDPTALSRSIIACNRAVADLGP